MLYCSPVNVHAGSASTVSWPAGQWLHEEVGEKYFFQGGTIGARAFSRFWTCDRFAALLYQVSGSGVGQVSAQHTMLQTISNPDGSMSIIQIDPGEIGQPQVITLPDGTQAQIVHAVSTAALHTI